VGLWGVFKFKGLRRVNSKIFYYRENTEKLVGEMSYEGRPYKNVAMNKKKK